MRRFSSSFLALGLSVIGVVAHSGEALAQCSSNQNVQSAVYIYKNSAPLRRGGVGTPLIGYRKEPTLIMNRNVSSRGTATVFDRVGKAIARCPWASAHGHAGGRYRCSMETASLRRAAVRGSGSPTVRFRIKGSTCVTVPDAGRCYGSVKGLCNSLIK